MSTILREPLFLSVQFLHLTAKDNKAPAISVRINLQRDDVIYATAIKSRMEVVGYEDPQTGLFVTAVEGVDTGNVYHQFRKEVVQYATQELAKFLDTLQKMSADDLKLHGYKPVDVLTNQLNKCLVDRQELYADLQKQINLVTSRKLPRVNEFLAYQDDTTLDFPVTMRLPYNNPKTAKLTTKQRELVDSYLDVFLDEYNKYALSWYMGAALCNVPLYDDKISKLAVVSSSHGGSGKSTLINSLTDALFTTHFREIKDEFDSFFSMNNKFGVSSLSCKRMSVYSEAKFNSDQTSTDHDFTGLNVSVIKSLITEGYVSSEAKYGDRAMDRLSGFHMVLTNHPPVITKENEALNRRIFPLMVKPTSMTSKAKELDLWGKQKLETYVQENVQAFANYFAHTFMEDEYAFIEHQYDHTDYTTDISDAQCDLEEMVSKNNATLKELTKYGFVRVIERLGEQENVDVSLLLEDIVATVNGTAPDELKVHMRLEDNTFYLDSSKGFLLRYGNYGTTLRQHIKQLYGTPIKKFQHRMFSIGFNASNK